MRRAFFIAHLAAVLKGGSDTVFGLVGVVFEGEALARLRDRVSVEALDTPVVFTDRMSNRTLAAHLHLRDGSRLIAVNVRFRADPEELAHAIVEEIAHAQQVLDGVDFEAERHLPYEERPYEQQAKTLATEVLGYEPADYIAIMRREPPSSPLYDITTNEEKGEYE